MEAMNANDNDAALRKNEDENRKWCTSDPLYTVSMTLNVEQVYVTKKKKKKNTNCRAGFPIEGSDFLGMDVIWR
jgi:hypothetical protein